MKQNVYITAASKEIMQASNKIYANLYSTLDVNECDEGTDVCAQNCVDTEGSYNCSCGIGYTLANDDVGCNGKN